MVPQSRNHIHNRSVQADAVQSAHSLHTIGLILFREARTGTGGRIIGPEAEYLLRGVVHSAVDLMTAGQAPTDIRVMGMTDIMFFSSTQGL